MPKKQGKVVSSTATKTGNLRVVLQTTKNPEFTFYVLKRNSNLYAIAQMLEKSEAIRVFLRRYLGKYYCTKIVKTEDGKLRKEEVGLGKE